MYYNVFYSYWKNATADQVFSVDFILFLFSDYN